MRWFWSGWISAVMSSNYWPLSPAQQESLSITLYVECAAFGLFRNEGPHQSWRQWSSHASRSFQHSSRSFILQVSTLPELYYAKEMRSGYFYFMVCQLEKNRLIAFICTHPHTYIQLVFANTVHSRSSLRLQCYYVTRGKLPSLYCFDI